MQKKEQILIIGKVWPEPGSSAAGSRMMQLIDLFRDRWEVAFACTAGESELSVDLESIGVKQTAIQLNSGTFDDFLEELNPGIVLFDRFMTEEQFGWRVAEQCPGALRILDTEDLHCLRSARQKAWKKGREFRPDMLVDEETAKREIAAIYRCDFSLIISEFEMNLLLNTFGLNEELLHYLPFLFDPAPINQADLLPGYDERMTFISIGNFLHEPNWNAVLWLKEQIWPMIREKLPEAVLEIYGAYPSQKVWQLHRPGEGFFVKGRAEDAKTVLKKARVLLAPLRFGAGLKGKLVEAMQCGTPSITTDIGAEGIAGSNEWCGLIENDPEPFANAATELFANRELWLQSQKIGFSILESRFNKSDFEEPFLKKIRQTLTHLNEHRRKNFTGAMLMHHTAASTKFMSRWIETKNHLSELSASARP